MEKVVMSYCANIDNLEQSRKQLYEIEQIALRLSKSFKVTVISNIYPSTESGLKNGVYHHYIGTPIKNKYIHMFAFRSMMLWIMLTKKYDIWLESDPTSLTSCIAQLFTKKPIVAIFQNTYKQKLGRIQSLALKWYRYGVVTSEFAKHQIRKVNPKLTIEIIPYAN